MSIVVQMTRLSESITFQRFELQKANILRGIVCFRSSQTQSDAN